MQTQLDSRNNSSVCEVVFEPPSMDCVYEDQNTQLHSGAASHEEVQQEKAQANAARARHDQQQEVRKREREPSAQIRPAVAVSIVTRQNQGNYDQSYTQKSGTSKNKGTKKSNAMSKQGSEQLVNDLFMVKENQPSTPAKST